MTDLHRIAFAALCIAPFVRTDEPKRDRFGDPLPAGAVARLGTVHAHPGVEAISFSADGKTLISVSRHCVRHWDAKTGRVIRLIERPAPPDAWQQVISADGRTAAVLWRDRLEIRDAETGRPRHRAFDVPSYESVTEFLVSPRGDLVWVSLLGPKNEPFTLAVRKGDSGKATLLPGVALHRGVVSPEGNLVAGTEVVNGARRVSCRAASGQLLFRLPFDGRPVAFTPDGRGLLVHDAEMRELILVDADKGKRRNVKLPPPSEYSLAEFSPDGHRLATVTGGQTNLWDLPSGKVVHRWPGARWVAFAPDGNRLAATNDLARCWDIETGKALWPDFGPLLGRDHVPEGFFSRSAGNLVATWELESSCVDVWDCADGAPRFRSELVGGRRAIWFAADGSRVHCCDGPRIRGWELPGGRAIANFSSLPPGWKNADWYATAARELFDGSVVAVLLVPAVGGAEPLCSFLARWDAQKGRLIDLREVVINYRSFARITPDGLHISDRDQLLDAITRRRQTVAAAPRGFEVSTPPEFTPDMQLAVGHLRPEVADNPCEVVVWECATGKPLLRRPVRPRQTVKAALSPDNRWLAVAAEQCVELWDLAADKRVAELRYRTPDVPYDATYYCTGLMFLPGRKLIAAYGDRTALVWEMPPGTEKPPPQRINERTWDDLAAAEPRPAQDAVWALINEPAKAVALLRERVRPPAPPADADLAALIADLGDASFARREAATHRLAELGQLVAKPLEAALPRAANAEQQRRLRLLVAACRDDGPRTADERRAVRAVQALGQITTPEAKGLLADWAKGHDVAILTREARAVLERLR